MARGFESKSVADQQESMLQGGVSGAASTNMSAERRRLELARLDVQHRLDQATTDNHKEMLRRALAALDQDLKR